MNTAAAAQAVRTITDAAIAGNRALKTVVGLTHLLDNIFAEDEDEAMRLPVEYARSAMSASVMDQHRIDEASRSTIWEAARTSGATKADLHAAITAEISGDARTYALLATANYYGEAAAEGHAL